MDDETPIAVLLRKADICLVSRNIECAGLGINPFGFERKFESEISSQVRGKGGVPLFLSYRASLLLGPEFETAEGESRALFSRPEP